MEAWEIRRGLRRILGMERCRGAAVIGFPAPKGFSQNFLGRTVAIFHVFVSAIQKVSFELLTCRQKTGGRASKESWKTQFPFLH